MVSFTLNSNKTTYTGDLEKNLLEFLRKEKFLTAAKDGCSGQGVCGACSVEIDGKIKMACRVKMKDIEGATINTLEGLSQEFKSVLGKHFAQKGTVQCGFC